MTVDTEADNSLEQIFSDERNASWKYLLPIGNYSNVLVISDKLVSTPISLARTAGSVTLSGLAPAGITLMREWARLQGIANLTVVDTPWDNGSFPENHFDLVVVSLAASGIMAKRESFFTSCCRILKQQGQIFQIGEMTFSGGRENMVPARKWIKLWQAHGCRVRSVYALLPRKERYKLVVPLRPVPVFSAGLRMHNTLMLSTKIQKLLVLLLGKIKVLEWVLPGYGLSISKEDTAPGFVPVDFIIKELAGKQLFGIVHNASPGRGGKAILKIVSKDGKALFYIKVADNVWRGKFIENEKNNLISMAKIKLNSALVPEIQHYCEKNGHYMLSLKAGKENLKSYGWKIGADIVDFLVELFRATATVKRIQETAFWAEINANLNVFGKEPMGRKYGWLGDLLARSAVELQDEYFPFGMVHRDFVGWNIKRQRDGRLYVMDWEWGRNDYLPFQDFFHFILLTEWANNRKSVLEVIRHNFLTRSAASGTLLRKYCDNISVPLKWSHHFFILYLIEWTVFHLLNSMNVGQWADETLSFLDRVWQDESFLADNWLK